MKKLLFMMLFLQTMSIFSQQFTTNTTPVGMEHNLLFDATNRYSVTQTGNATIYLPALFDGRFNADYTDLSTSTSSPTVILIEGLPKIHVQKGGWVGWATRYWQPKRFKIEGYNAYDGANEWIVLADYSSQDYTGGAHFTSDVIPNGAFTKLKYTIYSTYGTDNRLGLSEMFFIHPEAMTPYQGLLASESDITWKKGTSNTYFNTGNVGIGTSTPSSLLHINGKGGEPSENIEDIQNKASFILSSTSMAPEGLYTLTKLYAGIASQYTWFQAYNGHTTGAPKNIALNPKGGNVGIGTTTIPTDYKLAVAGKTITEEVKVQLQSNWPDYVFTKEYQLPTLKEVAQHINNKGHLQNIPSAKEVKDNGGIELGEMNRKLLEKIEELTLYTIQQQREIDELKKENSLLKKLEERINKLENKN